MFYFVFYAPGLTLLMSTFAVSHHKHLYSFQINLIFREWRHRGKVLWKTGYADVHRFLPCPLQWWMTSEEKMSPKLRFRLFQYWEGLRNIFVSSKLKSRPNHHAWVDMIYQDIFAACSWRWSLKGEVEVYARILSPYKVGTKPLVGVNGWQGQRRNLFTLPGGYSHDFARLKGEYAGAGDGALQ